MCSTHPDQAARGAKGRRDQNGQRQECHTAACLIGATLGGNILTPTSSLFATSSLGPDPRRCPLSRLSFNHLIMAASLADLKAITAEHVDNFDTNGRTAVRGANKRPNKQLEKVDAHIRVH